MEIIVRFNNNEKNIEIDIDSTDEDIIILAVESHNLLPCKKLTFTEENNYTFSGKLYNFTLSKSLKEIQYGDVLELKEIAPEVIINGHIYQYLYIPYDESNERECFVVVTTINHDKLTTNSWYLVLEEAGFYPDPTDNNQMSKFKTLSDSMYDQKCLGYLDFREELITKETKEITKLSESMMQKEVFEKNSETFKLHFYTTGKDGELFMDVKFTISEHNEWMIFSSSTCGNLHNIRFLLTPSGFIQGVSSSTCPTFTHPLYYVWDDNEYQPSGEYHEDPIEFLKTGY